MSGTVGGVTMGLQQGGAGHSWLLGRGWLSRQVQGAGPPLALGIPGGHLLPLLPPPSLCRHTLTSLTPQGR